MAACQDWLVLDIKIQAADNSETASWMTMQPTAGALFKFKQLKKNKIVVLTWS